MKKIISLLTLCTLLIIACNTGSNNINSLLPEAGDIKADEYIININSDTTLETKNGALLKIPKGSLTTDNGSTITLEIKEAYSMKQMILAGLTTQSDGEPLSSGGMIYINPAKGQHVTINQPIQVAIPADYLSKDMQLFKGEKDGKGNINWKEPIALPENKQLSVVEQGKTLFQSKCASCHVLGNEMVGPNLAHFMKRFPLDKKNNENYYGHYPDMYRLYPYNSPVDSTAKPDTGLYQRMDRNYLLQQRQHFLTHFIYKCNLKQLYRSTGPGFLADSDSRGDSLLNIYKYIQNESDRLNLPLPWQTSLVDCADSCRLYKEVTDGLTQKKLDVQLKRKNLINDNGPLVDKQPDSTWIPVIAPPPIDFDKKVSPENYDAEYYQFTITSFGWQNIDALLKGVESVQESELFVRITGQYQDRIKVYLIIPSVKTYGEGGPADRDPKEFAFFYKTGKLPLPQNVKAFILAVTDTENGPAFGIKEFTTSLKQELEVSLHPGTKEEFTAAINGLDLDRLHITLDKSKNSEDIIRTNKNLKNIESELKKAEGLKPKNCDCDCGRTIGPESADVIDEYIK